VKVEWRLFAGAGAFFSLTGTLYWFVSYEDAGTTMLALAVAAVFMVAGWLLFQSRKVGTRPEDRLDAEPGDGAGELGYFPSSSIWPFVLGCGAVVVANGFVFGVWLALFGGLLLLVGVIGYAFEASAKV
jgi:hypothetical protein